MVWMQSWSLKTPSPGNPSREPAGWRGLSWLKSRGRQGSRDPEACWYYHSQKLTPGDQSNSQSWPQETQSNCILGTATFRGNELGCDHILRKGCCQLEWCTDHGTPAQWINIHGEEQTTTPTVSNVHSASLLGICETFRISGLKIL